MGCLSGPESGGVGEEFEEFEGYGKRVGAIRAEERESGQHKCFDIEAEQVR